MTKLINYSFILATLAIMLILGVQYLFDEYGPTDYSRLILMSLFYVAAYITFTRTPFFSRYQRSFTMRSLVKNNVGSFPCMAPVANIDIRSMPLHEGPWRVAQTPLQFAVDNDLIAIKAGKTIAKELLLTKGRLANNESRLLLRSLFLENLSNLTVVLQGLGIYWAPFFVMKAATEKPQMWEKMGTKQMNYGVQ